MGQGSGWGRQPGPGGPRNQPPPGWQPPPQQPPSAWQNPQGHQPGSWQAPPQQPNSWQPPPAPPPQQGWQPPPAPPPQQGWQPPPSQPQPQPPPGAWQGPPQAQPQWGGPDPRAVAAYDSGKKSTLLAYVLWLLLGGLAAHRWYAGARRSAFVMTLMFLGPIAYLSQDRTVLAALEQAQQFGTALSLDLNGPPAIALMVLTAASLWWLIDLFRVPSLIRRANRRLAERMGLAPVVG